MAQAVLASGMPDNPFPVPRVPVLPQKGGSLGAPAWRRRRVSLTRSASLAMSVRDDGSRSRAAARAGFRVPDFNPVETIASRGTVVEAKATEQAGANPA